MSVPNCSVAFVRSAAIPADPFADSIASRSISPTPVPFAATPPSEAVPFNVSFPDFEIFDESASTLAVAGSATDGASSGGCPSFPPSTSALRGLSLALAFALVASSTRSFDTGVSIATFTLKVVAESRCFVLSSFDASANDAPPSDDPVDPQKDVVSSKYSLNEFAHELIN
jgi:hypothetical protein